jgi:hypothetical protein
MSKYGINGIIRGHQDSISNSLVFKNKNDKVLFNQLYRTNTKNLYNIYWKFLFNQSDTNTEKLNNIYWNDRKDRINSNRYFGPLARLHIDRADNLSDLIHPVVTLSTNTDAGRNLTADSFGLLRFDIQPSNIEDFNQNSLTSKNKIVNLNNPEVELVKQKYLKYKIKYIQLKKIISSLKI